MFTACDRCGNPMKNLGQGKSIEGEMQCACGYGARYKRWPLFVLTGASGVGKSTIGRYLMRDVSPVAVMESDILWNDYYNQPQTNYREYREKWLDLCRNIGQAGKPVLLIGCGIPEHYERLDGRGYFCEIIYLALVSSGQKLAAQLRARPAFRNCGNDQYIQEHLTFNEWIRANCLKTNPAMALLDIENLSAPDAAHRVKAIIENKLDALICNINNQTGYETSTILKLGDKK